MPPSTRTLFNSPTAAQSAAAGDSVFRRFVNEKRGLKLLDYWELHAWSVAEQNDFWTDAWEFGNIIGTKEPLLFDNSYPISEPNPRLIRAKLNFAENMLLSHANARSNAVALISLIEPDSLIDPSSPAYLDSTFTRSLTYEQLYQEVRQMAFVLKSMGVVPGDRVAAYAPTCIEMIVATLATAVIGAVWTSCTTESGTKSCLERFAQVEPKVIFTADTFRLSKRTTEIYPNLVIILDALPSVTQVIVVGHLHLDRLPRIPFPAQKKNGAVWSNYMDLLVVGDAAPAEIPFWRGSAMAPLYVLYSSGTTGQPKPIIHSVGGMVMSSKMTNLLHNGYKAGDCLLQVTTLSWMMYNYAVSTLACGCTVAMYDGSPLSPLPILFSLVEKYRVTNLGISPRYMQILETAGYIPKNHHDLSSLDIIAVAGSVLKAELYSWVRDCVGENIFINNGSGGTDICNLFVGGVRSLPVYYAEIQAPGLGFALEAWDDDGNVVVNDQGNMIIRKPFPNLPLGFWGDEGNKRYKASYFEEYKTPVWYQGDWIEMSSLTGGCTIFGRSDAVLNPGGVRFGSSELYSAVEDLRDVVEDCIAVAQKLGDGDERVILFVKPKDKLTPEVIKMIQASITHHLSRRHIPALILHCDKIPYTMNGKRLEVATKKLVNGTPLSKINLSTAEDPECLKVFINHPALILPIVTRPKL